MSTLPHPDLASSVPTDTADPKTALVTGSSGGVGLALAQKLAASGWRVLVHGRNPDKLDRARASLGMGEPHEAFRADLSDPEAVLQLSEQVREATDRLDVLVHNAGLLRPQREHTHEGVEMTVAVNALAPFVLTRALRPLVEQTAQSHGDARIVVVSSEAHRGARLPTIDPDALAHYLRGAGGRYHPIRAYARSKIVATAWTLELSKRLEDAGVVANACHPGLVRTGVFTGFGPILSPVMRLFSPMYLSPSVGAESPFMLATDPRYAERTGRWITRSHLRAPHEATPSQQARDPAVGTAVWDALHQLADA